MPAGTRSIGTVFQLTGDPNRANRYNDAYADDLSLTLSATLAAPAVPAPPASTVPAFDHVFFVMVENKSYDQVIGNSAARYLSRLASNNVVLGQSYGLIHPSDPNYMAVAGGSTFGHVDNPMPGAIGSLTTPNIGNLAERAGKSWRGYVEDMHSPCNLAKNGHYDPDNVPFPFFRDVAADPARCQDKLQPITRWWTDLGSTATTPNFVWFEPNSCNTMHDCDVAALACCRDDSYSRRDNKREGSHVSHHGRDGHRRRPGHGVVGRDRRGQLACLGPARGGRQDRRRVRGRRDRVVQAARRPRRDLDHHGRGRRA
ncbi:hypothetical protein F0L68_05435 [Solihabitans fulvus]|uniref:Phosphoesterase family protein n=1 Tax=Solihabitans fulvus TaxID=1892852 RepID=A0A5B2XP22_9PSEU|nr:hypothetical protein F0L68_05435 [Solihabitans fulvus]